MTNVELTVGGQSVACVVGEPIVFDDSYYHSVSVSSQSTERVTLIIDIWHPDLAARHDLRRRINEAFPPPSLVEKETDVGFDAAIFDMFKVRPHQMKAVLLVSPVCASKLQMPFDAVRMVLASFIPTTLYPVTYARDVFCDVSFADAYDFLFKMVLIGDSGCGKSCFLLRYADQRFSSSYISTIGVDFKVRIVGYRREPAACVEAIKLQIWDVAGPERFKTITNAYYRGARGIFACFNVSSRPTFENVKHWVGEIRKHAKANCVFIVVGMQADDAKPREVPMSEAEALAHSYHVPYVECSSRDDYQVQDAVATMVHLIRKAFIAPPAPPKVVQPPRPPTKRCQLM